MKADGWRKGGKEGIGREGREMEGKERQMGGRFRRGKGYEGERWGFGGREGEMGGGGKEG